MVNIDVASYIENEKCYDSVKNNDNGILDYLNSLTEKDIEIIENQISGDEELRQKIDELTDYYLYHYKDWYRE